MQRPWSERYTSRKFLAAVIAALTAFVTAYYPDFPARNLELFVWACLGYAGIEGAVDASHALVKWWTARKGNDD